MDTPTPVSLYLRADGTLLLVKGNQTIEIRLTARQLLDLGFDGMRVALALDPSMANQIADVFATTYVIPTEGPLCQPLN